MEKVKIYHLVYEDYCLDIDGKIKYLKNGDPVVYLFDLGYYTDEVILEQVKDRYSHLPGFCEHKEYFKVYEMVLNEIPEEEKITEWVDAG